MYGVQYLLQIATTSAIVLFSALWHCVGCGKYQRFGEIYASVFNTVQNKFQKVDSCVLVGAGKKRRAGKRGGEKKLPGMRW
jgi:hypothetical protein